MNSANKFRFTAVVVAALMTVYAFESTFSDIFALRQPTFPADPSKIVFQAIPPIAQWANTISPFRADLEANYASAVALMALRPNSETLSAADAQRNADSQEDITRVLKTAPHHSELWLLLALLQTQRYSGAQQTIEALKMSYFTAPNDAQLMPLRLYAATISDALSDPDLKELARGDVRLMLLRQPDMKASVLFAYRRGSSLGKAFLEDAAQSIDPGFISALRNS